jgi:hypothetical protein
MQAFIFMKSVFCWSSLFTFVINIVPGRSQATYLHFPCFLPYHLPPYLARVSMSRLYNDGGRYMNMNIKHQWNDNWWGKAEVLGENFIQCQSVLCITPVLFIERMLFSFIVAVVFLFSVPCDAFRSFFWGGGGGGWLHMLILFFSISCLPGGQVFMDFW